jgi:hypothetical protein
LQRFLVLTARKRTSVIATADEPLALRLVSALMQGWDSVPLATRRRILRDAALMDDGEPNAIELPTKLLALINLHKGGTSAGRT